MKIGDEHIALLEMLHSLDEVNNVVWSCRIHGEDSMISTWRIRWYERLLQKMIQLINKIAETMHVDGWILDVL